MSRTLAALGLGAALMYVLDPINGRRRRHVLRDRARRILRAERQLLDKAGRDLSNRAHGLAERVRHPTPTDVPDEVLAERVRAAMGRLVAHPSSIEVSVRDGCAILRGPILEAEVRALVRAVERVPGVRAIADELERHRAAGEVPGLQGRGGGPGGEPWSPSAQAAAGLGGAGAIAIGLVRGGLGGLATVLAGSALIARAVSNRPLRELLGIGDRTYRIVVRKSITIHAPIDQVYALWTRYEEFPRFMEHVQSVEALDLERRRLRWRVDGPAGASVGFDVEVTEREEDHKVSWRTLPDQPIEHDGTIRFEPSPDGGTRVHILMRYAPPAAAVGHTVARIFGWDPKARLDDDLVRVKGLLEHGFTRAHGVRVSVDDLGRLPH